MLLKTSDWNILSQNKLFMSPWAAHSSHHVCCVFSAVWTTPYPALNKFLSMKTNYCWYSSFKRLLNRSCCAFNCISSGRYGTESTTRSYTLCPVLFVIFQLFQFHFFALVHSCTQWQHKLLSSDSSFSPELLAVCPSSKTLRNLHPQKYRRGWRNTLVSMTKPQALFLVRKKGQKLLVKQSGKAVIMTSASKLCIKSIII